MNRETQNSGLEKFVIVFDHVRAWRYCNTNRGIINAPVRSWLSFTRTLGV